MSAIHEPDRGLVSVVIVGWNSGASLEKCLDHVFDQTYTPIEIIVVDNHSTDGSVEALRTRGYAARIAVLSQPDNFGFSVGMNQGIRKARGKYVLLLNPDMFLDQTYVARSVEAFETLATPDVAVVGGIVYRYACESCTSQVESVGWYLRPYHAVTNSTNMTRPELVFGPAGSAPLCLKGALDAVRLPDGDYLDPSYFLTGEDIELYLRLHLLGWRCLFVPIQAGWHIGSASVGAQGISGFPNRLQVHAIKNRFFTILTCYPVLLWLRMLPWQAIATGGQIGQALVTGNGRFLLNWGRAVWLTCKMLPLLMRKRRWLQGARRVSSRDLQRLFVHHSIGETLRSLFQKG